MKMLTATLDFYLLKLQSGLILAAGLPEEAANNLVRGALPAMVQALGTQHNLGDADGVLALCQKFAQARVYDSLTELTRTDGGWPEQRQYLTLLLLGDTAVAGLVSRYAPLSDEAAAHELLGYLSLLLLATAGQHALETGLEAAPLRQWLHQQALAGAAWAPLAIPAALAQPAALASTGPQAADATAPWWPLLVLAVVGIAASTYFWREQTALAGRAALRAVQHAVTAVAPAVHFAEPDSVDAADWATEAAPAAEATPPRPAKAPAPAATAAAPPAQPGLATLQPRPVSFQLSDSAGTAPVPVPALAPRTTVPTEAPAPVKTAAPQASAGAMPSAEGVLFKRLMNRDAHKQPIFLEDVRFSTAQAQLNTKGAQQLENIAALLKSFPKCQLVVYGYSDASEPNAQALALDRANSVIAELLKLKVPKHMLVAQARVNTPADNAEAGESRRQSALLVSVVN